MTACKMRVRFWVIEKAQEAARRYGMYIDCVDRTTDEHGLLCADNDGCYTVVAEKIISETEKAVQVQLSTGMTDGSVKGWKLWIPKSQIVEEIR